MDEKITWNIIDKYFYDNPNVLVEHHIESPMNFIKLVYTRFLKKTTYLYSVQL